ncbi:hypothetical protein M8J77_004690 [Diaphorina citri]|nr:hypothetical protein M8J77_004690 [Diaphorina citri]
MVLKIRISGKSSVQGSARTSRVLEAPPRRILTQAEIYVAVLQYDVLQVEENTSESRLTLKKHVESPDSPNGKPNNIPSILAHPTGNTQLTDSWQQQI